MNLYSIKCSCGHQFSNVNTGTYRGRYDPATKMKTSNPIYDVFYCLTCKDFQSIERSNKSYCRNCNASDQTQLLISIPSIHGEIPVECPNCGKMEIQFNLKMIVD